MKHKLFKKRSIKIISISLFILVLVISIPLYLINNKLNKVNIQKIDKSPQELLIDENTFKVPEKSEDNFINILLLGIDSRDTSKDPGRSDSMIIATIDKKHNKIKLTSLMRDTIVDMVGHGPMDGLNQDRLNHTYAYGGPTLTMKTINQNFNMNIKDYIKVDFWGLEKIIDLVGGVDINVRSEEIQYLNSYMKEVSGIKKESYIPVTHAGLQRLNGRQAVAYSRIRYIGTDFERTERQRKVLTDVFGKLTQKKALDLYKIIDSALPYVETSLDKNAIIKLATTVLTNKISTVEQFRIPTDQLSYSTYVRGDYFIGWKKKETIDALHKFIFETELYYPPQN